MPYSSFLLRFPPRAWLLEAAATLGVRRTQVGAVAALTQKTGLVHAQSSALTIVGRRGLESCSCACYQLIRAEFDRVVT